ncbi:MAG: Ribonuclease G [Verrucomicrobia bacterium ADurb.Bin122]|jgi:ribonuclease G|nr:MAG: Ribonuclease G [Verrucomicrobia bacterium ADurb.Bin122]HOG93221.1 Rne/Rng family ribonuclease [Opitutaceae bacterium]HOY54373.1 Rne/Rng family ribonuclease [Opitutaceae bacterium]
MSDSTSQTPPDSNQDAARNLEDQLSRPPEPAESIDIDRNELRASAAERAKQRPLLQKILSVFQKSKTSYRELIINSEPLEKRVALLLDGRLEKFEIERHSDDRMVGGIFKGRIKNLDAGLKAAFVDIGYSKNAFLHYWDMLPAAADSSVEVVRVNKKKNAAPRPAEPTVKDIPSLYPPGTDIVIQVTKGPIGTKGPRTTTNLSLPGRYLILTPFSDGCGISRKIEDPAERKRLKQLINELTIPEGMGVIVRTAGEGKKSRYFVRDLHLLLKKWEEIQQKMQSERAPACLYQEPDIVERTVRDFLTEEVDRVLIDNKDDHARTADLVGLISKRSRSKIALYKDNIPIFERFNIERQIEQTFQRKVTLPSGGEIVIDETEALIAIDVNTGSHKNRSGDEKNTIYAVNLEAAEEIARQIRLRNLGGLIIMDFIDMKERRHRNAIYDKMVELMSEDKAKTHILPISQLGIMQMTRQRQQESLSSNLYTDCPYCRGRGIVKSATTMSVELQRRLSAVARRVTNRNDGKEYSLRVMVHPSILERLRSEDADLLVRMEKTFGVKLAFRADAAYHVENFKIVNANTGEEYR